jgi:hypothetical protein
VIYRFVRIAVKTNLNQVGSIFESLRYQNNPDCAVNGNEYDEYDYDPAYKRVRTLSPRTTQRKVAAKKHLREKKRSEERTKRFDHWKQSRHDAFMEEVYADAEWSSPSKGAVLVFSVFSICKDYYLV